MFTNEEKDIISQAVMRYLVNDAQIIDKHGNVRDDMTIDLKTESKGFDYWLQKEESERANKC